MGVDAESIGGNRLAGTSAYAKGVCGLARGGCDRDASGPICPCALSEAVVKESAADEAPQRWLTGLEVGIALATGLLGLFILLKDLAFFGNG